MHMIYYFFVIIILILGVLGGFFAKELIKKFGFWKEFERHYSYKKSWHYQGNRKPGMYTLRISSTSEFAWVFGFDFSFWKFRNIGFDVFWYVESKSDKKVDINLFLWDWWVELKFLFTTHAIDDISFEILESVVQNPDYVFYPHWWQRLGLFS